MWEKDIDIHKVFEMRTKTTTYFGVGAIQKFAYIAKQLQKSAIDKLIVVTGKSAYQKTGAWKVVEEVLKEKQIEYILFDKITPNPEHQTVDMATKAAVEFGAQAVIGIGGGSAIDAAKAIAILTEYPTKSCKSLYYGEFFPEKALPLIAINLTHGTGTEVDRFSVVSVLEENKKIGIASEYIYPLYAINDPQLMTTLPKFQTMAVSVDAINHVFEAATSNFAHPFTLMNAKEAVRLIYKYLPRVLLNGEDLEARYYLAYAAMIAGVSFDNGRLHFTHALEHPLSAVKPEVTHGLGLAVLLPAVLKQCFEAKKATILDVFTPIFHYQSDMKTEQAVEMIRAWLKSVGANQSLSDLGFSQNDIDKLTDLVPLERLSQSAPVAVSREVVRDIYQQSL